jgi:hypothetical protein
MTSKRTVKLPHRDASIDKFDYAYDYNYYITEDNNYYDDRNCHSNDRKLLFINTKSSFSN